MKKLKVLCSLFGVSVLCCMGLMTDANAAVIYDVGNVSETHSYKGVTQKYTLTGTVTIIGDMRNLSNLSIDWSSKGSGNYSVSHGNLSVHKITDTYRQYTAPSKITVGGVVNQKSLLCTLWW